jgi:hypothetical protein
MSAFNDAWTLLKQQMSLRPFGFATGDPTQDALAYLGAGSGAQEGPMTVPYADHKYQDFLDRQKTAGVPQYELDVTRNERDYKDGRAGLQPYLTADGETVGRFPMSPTDTQNLRREITRGRGRDVVAHTSMPIDNLITDYHGNTHFMDSATAVPKAAFYPTGSVVDNEHQGKGLYIRSLLSLLSTPEAMGLSAKDVAREEAGEQRATGYELSDVDPELFNELYGQRGLISPPSRSGGKGGSDRSHKLLSEQYKRIMDLPDGNRRHTYGEGETLSNIIDMAERGEGMFGRGVGGKLKHNLEEGSFGELRNPRTKEALKNPRGKTFFYDPIPVDVGKNPLEEETFGDLRRFDLAGLPVRVKRQVTPTKRKRSEQTRLDRFSQRDPLPDLDEIFYRPADMDWDHQPTAPEQERARRNLEELTTPRPRDRAFARQREQRVQEAIDSLGDLFTTRQGSAGEAHRVAAAAEAAAETASITGEDFNETLVNTERDVDIKNSLKFFNELLTERSFNEHGFAHPNSFDSLPEDMQINLARDVAFLENMQSQNSRSDALREALRRAEEKREGSRIVTSSDGKDIPIYMKEHFDDIFNPDVPVENTEFGGAVRRDIIFEEIDKAITRVRILNHHLRTYRSELTGVGGEAEQEQAHGLLRNHLDDLFHPLHGYMMGYNEGRV